MTTSPAVARESPVRRAIEAYFATLPDASAWEHYLSGDPEARDWITTPPNDGVVVLVMRGDIFTYGFVADTFIRRGPPLLDRVIGELMKSAVWGIEHHDKSAKRRGVR